MSQASLVLTAIAILPATYLIGLCIQRIYLSPVSHVPGPLLAKITYWYEFYYDVTLRGQYTFHIRKLHERYGPMIRINPEEVHCADPDFYDFIYTGSSQRRDKWSWFCRQFGIPDSTFATVGHDRHRLRRSALGPFFSKAKVRSLQPLIEEVVGNLLSRFEESQMLDSALTISLAFAALTNDIVEQYALGQNDKRVFARDFDPSFHDASLAGSFMGHLTKQFPFILRLMQLVPDNITILFKSSMASYVKLQRVSITAEISVSLIDAIKDIKSQIELINQNRDSNKYKDASHQTIFHEILNSDLPPTEKSPSRLWQDAQVTVIAGTLTTASALSYTLFSLLSQPSLLRRLRSELETAIPNPKRIPQLATLEQLPFLTACIKEGLRLSNGVSTRLQRIDPDNPVVFTDRTRNIGKRYILPPGTPLSMTGMLIHQDASIFPEPLLFKPDRWLDNPGLEKYLVPFSRGTRQCIGINLAYAEIYITLAVIFRLYGSPEVKKKGDRGYVELFETEWARDVEIVGDGVTPLHRKESQGIRIKVKL